MSHVITLVADRNSGTLGASTISAVQELSPGATVKILSPREAVDITVSEPVRPESLQAAVAGMDVDAIVTRSRGRRKGLLVADMDSTIVTSETLDELAAYAGLKDEIAAITRASMNGEIDFSTALRKRVAMLKGLGLDALDATWERTVLTEGARELVATMRAHGAMTALVSGGFTYFTGKVAELIGFDVNRANTLLHDGSALNGEVGEPILDRDAKLATLRELAETRGIRMAATLAIGDGANDLAMLREAGLGIAFHAKPIVAAEARARIDFSNLRAALFAQGYDHTQFVAG